MPRYGVFDPRKRAEEKAASRREDAEALASGRVVPAEMQLRNGFFSTLDLGASRVVAIGAGEVRRYRGNKKPQAD